MTQTQSVFFCMNCLNFPTSRRLEQLRHFFGCLALSFAVALPPAFAQDTNNAAASNSFSVTIKIDAAKPVGQIKPFWRFFGADEPNYAYFPHGNKLIGELGELRPQQVYFRAHNLLTSGDGTPALKWGSTGAYHEDAQGNPVYDWTILDRIFDTYLERGVRPYAQIGFMPKDLSTHPDPYQHNFALNTRGTTLYTGWSYPPKDYAKWGELAYQWTKHCVEKYGRAEVEQWYWEVWNEANIGYWHGTPEEFRKLYDYAIDGVRRALPTARVGGPEVAGDGGPFTRGFLEHCLRGTNFATGKIGSPVDFISFHSKGSPQIVQGHEEMGISAELRTIQNGFRIVASFPELKDKPIIIGECDPESCAACDNLIGAYRNTTLYPSYTAACFVRAADLAEKIGVNLEGAITWAFEFEDLPIFSNSRALASQGLDKPVVNVFRMFSKMSGQRLAVESDGAVSLDTMVQSGVRGNADVSAYASLDQGRLCVMVWNYHDVDVPGPEAEVSLNLTGLPAGGQPKLQEFRIDHDHSNAYTAWQEMGKPLQPTPEQIAQLEKASKLAALGQPELIHVENGQAMVKMKLPRQAVSLVVIQW